MIQLRTSTLGAALRPLRQLKTSALVSPSSASSSIPRQLRSHSSSTILIPSLVIPLASTLKRNALLSSSTATTTINTSTTPIKQQRRTFLPGLTSSSSSSAPEFFSATRKLPHPPSKVFDVVSDVDSYSAFLPYCLSSRVTHRTPPPENLPTSADLRVGFAGMDETFTSKVTCSPPSSAGKILEADASQNSIFEVLRARWTVSGAKTGSDVKLDIEYKFANPLYAALSSAVMPKVAGILIEAFEKRTMDVLSGSSKS